MARDGWLDRYRDGERDEVWQELRTLGAGVRHPDRAVEAQSVCDEMARRARHNVEVLVERLTAQGYRFHSNDAEQQPVIPFHPATTRAGALVAWLERDVGAVPMTVASWLRLVGDVWLVGTHPRWRSAAAADPLVIEPAGMRWPEAAAAAGWAEELAMWHAVSDDADFVFPVAPDRLHKANVSGGDPYGFRLPDAGVDAVFVGEATTSFVAYLNHVFTHGGFPGPVDGDDAAGVRRALADGLLPL